MVYVLYYLNFIMKKTPDRPKCDRLFGVDVHLQEDNGYDSVKMPYH